MASVTGATFTSFMTLSNVRKRTASVLMVTPAHRRLFDEGAIFVSGCTNRADCVSMASIGYLLSGFKETAPEPGEDRHDLRFFYGLGRAQAAARSSRRAFWRALRVSEAARSYSAHASSMRPSF